MANFAPKAEANKAKGGELNPKHEVMAPPVMHLEPHHVEKLFKGKMPPVGSKIKVTGLAHVGAVSENQDSMQEPGRPRGSGASTPRQSMTLHLHKMDVGSDGINDEDEQQSQRDGAKAEIDKALTKDAGSAAAKGKPVGKTPAPRGGED